MDQQGSSAGTAVSPQTAQSNNSLAGLLKTVSQLWVRYGIYLLAILFTVVIFVTLVNKHNAFNTRTYDFARFSQAIWNTLQGNLLFSTIDHRSILGNHFSPYMALLSPLFLIWRDERVLFLVQAVSVAAAGLILGLILCKRYPALAPWFLIAFYMNPAVHSMALFEFRRVVLALPYLALALFALDSKRRWLMLGGLLMALLAKEDIGLFVFGVGLFLLIIQKDWRWGLGMMLLGFAWSLVISFWVIPAFRTPGTEYPQLYYFDYLGGSYSEIVGTLRTDPLILPRQLFSLSRLSAVFRILLPVGIFLPFLGIEWLLIALPPLFMLMISGDPEMYGLLKWYPATILPVTFAAVGMGIGRFKKNNARWLTIWLLLASIVGYWLYSPLPGGREYISDLFEVTEHDQSALAMVEEIPSRASVATQPHYAPHLIQRESLYHYPWIKIGAENIDYFLFDQQSSPYPFTNEEMAAEINTYLANPAMKLMAENDGIYLFQQNSSNEPIFTSAEILEDSIKLQGFDIAIPDEQGIYRVQEQLQPKVEPGQTIRVDLYWKALDTPELERTVSVRASDPSGWLFAQDDGKPAAGSKPTSWWKPGQEVRDVHYLTLTPDTPAGTLSLDILLYDTFTQAIIPWANGNDVLNLSSIEVGP